MNEWKISKKCDLCRINRGLMVLRLVYQSYVI